MGATVLVVLEVVDVKVLVLTIVRAFGGTEILEIRGKQGVRYKKEPVEVPLTGGFIDQSC